ncbi:MAG: enoyl-CoA hydratase [Aquisalimonadaceae bacterium]
MTKPVLTALTDGVMTITLNRPEKRNALTSEMYGLIRDGLTAAREDPATRVVVITGAGDSFTAGNDLQGFASLETPGEGGGKAAIWQLMDIMIDYEKPVIASVRGPAVGIGTTLLLHCDLVIAGEGARFALPFTRLGLVPEFGSSMLLPLLGGRLRAAHTLLLGESFGVDWARELGLVSQVCADTELEQVTLERAGALAALPPRALRETKRLINSPALREQLHKVIEMEAEAFRKGLASEEHKEAVGAFFENRPPDFGRFR